MIYEICTATDTGLARDTNEDSVALDLLTGLCVLADGMGGYKAGEIASGMATAFVKSELSCWLSNAGKNANSTEVKRAMEISAENANHSIVQAARSNPEYSGMGTTLVVGVFQAGRVMLGHIGDSRCYRLRGDTLKQVTKDHSLRQEQIDAGLITPEQALTAANKNLVTRALGINARVFLDVTEHRVDAGDIYLMCSDGLTDMVRDDVMANILLDSATLQRKSRQLIRAANANGGLDNITVVLVRAVEPKAKRSLMARMWAKKNG
jgi:protein phosphatase